MSEQYNDIDELIGKVLAGEASHEEQLYVDQWCALRAENQEYFDDMKLIFGVSAGKNVKIDFDADAAWQKVQQKLNASREETPVVPIDRKPDWRQVLRIAAGILLVISAGIFAWTMTNKPEQKFALTSDTKVVQDSLPDGSTAVLNKKSSLTYEYDSKKSTRTVKLKGEGFFDVVHHEEKPFVIETDETIIRDIGTSFNVKSYPDKDTIQVIVTSGIVQFYTKNNPGLEINAGETGLYSKRNKAFTLIPKADTNILAYKTRVFSFHSTDLKSVVDQINDVYDSHIKLGNEKIAGCQLTVTFRNDELENMVDIIAETLSLTVERTGQQEIILNGPGCH